jgi:hypothetical protein
MEGSVRTALPDEVHFEVPRDCARFCKGHPVRVGSLDPIETGVILAWSAETLRFGSRGTLVEWDRRSVRGFVVNLAAEITGTIASTIRIAFQAPDGGLATLHVFSCNLAHAAWFRRWVSILRESRIPVRIFSSVKALISQQT